MKYLASLKTKPGCIALIIIILLSVAYFTLYLIVINIPPYTPISYSNKEIIDRSIQFYHNEKSKIDDIAMALHNTCYDEKFGLAYTKEGYTFGLYELNDKYWDILLKVNRLYPDGWSFPYERISYTPEMIIIRSYYNNYGYFAYLVMCNLTEEEFKKEFPRMRIYSGRCIPEEPNCFYWIEGDWYVYFSRGRIEPDFPNYNPDLDTVLINFNYVKDTLNYVVDVLLKANPSDTIWMRNYSSKYLPGFFDIYKVGYELLPHQTYKESISKYLDAFFQEEFYYFIWSFPNNKISLKPLKFEDWCYLYFINPKETISRDYPDFKVYTQGDNIDNPQGSQFLYKIDDHWYIQKYK